MSVEFNKQLFYTKIKPPPTQRHSKLRETSYFLLWTRWKFRRRPVYVQHHKDNVQLEKIHNRNIFLLPLLSVDPQRRRPWQSIRVLLCSWHSRRSGWICIACKDRTSAIREDFFYSYKTVFNKMEMYSTIRDARRGTCSMSLTSSLASVCVCVCEPDRGKKKQRAAMADTRHFLFSVLLVAWMPLFSPTRECFMYNSKSADESVSLWSQYDAQIPCRLLTQQPIQTCSNGWSWEAYKWLLHCPPGTGARSTVYRACFRYYCTEAQCEGCKCVGLTCVSRNRWIIYLLIIYVCMMHTSYMYENINNLSNKTKLLSALIYSI